MRQCPFSGCGLKIGDEIFACRRHWFSLTRQQRGQIKIAYAQYVEGEIGVEKLREIQQKILGDRGTA